MNENRNEERPLRSYEMQNIRPFNDVYYVDCVHLTFFTAVRFFQGSIFRYVANNHFVYQIEETTQGLSLALDCRLAVPLPELNVRNGLEVEEKSGYFPDVIDLITDSLLNGKLVLLPVDGFYYKHPYHDLFYSKEHHRHYILIYGFDADQSLFKTIEANGFAWDTKHFCYTHEIGYQNLVECHKGVVDHWPTEHSLAIISKLSPAPSVQDDPQLYEHTVLKNMKLYKNEIIEGLQHIQLLAERIEQFDLSLSTLFDNRVASLSNKFKIESIMGGEHPYGRLFTDIVDSWRIIEMMIVKERYQKDVTRGKLADKLYQLYEMETELYEQLFADMDSASA